MHHIERIFNRKELSTSTSTSSKTSQKRLQLDDLVFLCTGSIVGSGVFVLIGVVIADISGPAVVLSMLIAGMLATCCSLCYSELSGMLGDQQSGSAYQFAYFALGELPAWLIGWAMLAENMAGASAVAAGWSIYFSSVASLEEGGILNSATVPNFDGVNVVAISVLLLVGFVNLFQLKDSSKLNSAVVLFKLFVIICFIAVTTPHIDWDQFQPLVRDEYNGWFGVLHGAGSLTFAFSGFDAIATTAKETDNAHVTIPAATVISMCLVFVLYIFIAICLVGVLNPLSLAAGESFAIAIDVVEKSGNLDLEWLRWALAIGAMIGITTVIYACILASARIVLSMAQDGLLPKKLASIHSRLHTPWIATIVTTAVEVVLGGLLPLQMLISFTSMGTLCSFVIVPLSLTVLRYRWPTQKRSFKLAGGPFLIPVFCAIGAIALISTMPYSTICAFFGWMTLGLVVYLAYGMHTNRVEKL